jgi:hypothetical protein
METDRYPAERFHHAITGVCPIAGLREDAQAVEHIDIQNFSVEHHQ